MTATAQQQVDAPPAPAPRPRAANPLRLADGVELIGHYEGSGFEKPPLLARRADGQMVQLTKPLYAIAALADGQRDARTIAEILTRASNRTFSEENVQMLVDKRLRPVGVLARADGSCPEIAKREALMALQHRRPVLSEKAVNVLSRPFTWLHRPLVTVAAVLALIAFDVWLFGFHGIAPGLRSAIYNPVLLLGVVGSVVLATAFHEIGHASACRYSGGRPGVMGVGFYLVYPAFYCDVTDAYRLKRSGRLRTDLGGVYFNGIFALLAGVVYFATGEEAALFTAAVMHLIMLQQLLPLMRFDGYYVLTDLTGVPDILSRIKPIFRSLVRGRRNEPRVAELKRWVRWVVTIYLVTLVPTLVFLFVWMIMGAPRVLATVYDSFARQLERFTAADGFAEAGAGVVAMLALALPVAGVALSLARVSRMAGRGLARWSSGSLARRVVAVLTGTVVIAALAYTWWPNGDYEPIRSGERGVVGEALNSVPGAHEDRPVSAPGEGADLAPSSGGAPGRAADPQGRRIGDARSVDEHKQANDHRDDSGQDSGAAATEGEASDTAPERSEGTATEPSPTTETQPSPPESAPSDTSSPDPITAPTTDPPADTTTTSPDTSSASPDSTSTSPEPSAGSDTATAPGATSSTEG